MDGKGNLIPLSQMLCAHFEAIDPTDLWTSIQTRSNVHKQNIPVLGHCPTNSITIDPNTPIMTTHTSPIMDHHVEVNLPEGSSMAMVNELLEDPHIHPRMMQAALSAVTSLFTPNKSTQPPESDGPIVHHKVSVSCAPNSTDRPDIYKELNTYKNRLALELNNFKKQLEMQSKIEVKCEKQNLKLEYDHELRHQTLTQTETVNTLRQQIDHLGAGSHPTHALSVTTSTSNPGYNSASPPLQYHYSQNVSQMNSSLVEVMDDLNRSMTNQYTVLQETLRQSQSALKEH